MADSNTPPATSGTAYTFGYARVSTSRQDQSRQLDALGKQEIAQSRLYVDKGRQVRRAGPPQQLLGQAQPGDVIVANTLDWLGRTRGAQFRA